MDDHLALVGKSISSYLVVDRRVQGSRLLRHSNGVPGLLSVTSVLVPNLLDDTMALYVPISGRNIVPPTIRAIALRPWKLMYLLISWQRPAIFGRMAKVRLSETPACEGDEGCHLPVPPAFTCMP